MIEILIKEPDKNSIRKRLVPGVYRVGSSPASHIQIDRPEVSSRHARLIVGDNFLRVADTDSSNGTYLNGKVVGREPVDVPFDSTITIGMAEIHLLHPEGKKEKNTEQSPAPHNSAKVYNDSSEDEQKSKSIFRNIEVKKEPEVKISAHTPEDTDDYIPILKVSGIPASARPLVQEIKRRAHGELLHRLNLKRLALSGISDEELRDKAKKTIHDILGQLSIPLPEGVTRDIIEKELVHEAIGLGPLEDLIARDDITEIMVNGHNQVFVEKAGTLYLTDTAFADDSQVQAAIERIVSPLGRRIDESSPMVDARLPDGSRVNAIIPPLSLVGPSITIRKFSKTPYTVDDLIRFGSLTQEMAHFLRICVKIRKNIIISGGTGSGKTTLLNVLSSFLPSRERIITIEDAAELQLNQAHVVRLEARPPNIEGKGEITIRDLVKNALRMRPDRIVVGECRGGEALDMLQAMNTGHDGSLTTIHANSPRDALSRLETLVLMAGFDLPLRAIREQIASAITIIVQISRHKDGTRKVTSISEITKMEGDIITMQDLFVFKHEGWTTDGKVKGRHIGTGSIPTFMEEIKRAKLNLDISMFQDGRGARF